MIPQEKGMGEALRQSRCEEWMWSGKTGSRGAENEALRSLG